MKRFCLYVAAFAVVLSLILAGGIAFKCRYVPRHIDWSLPSGTRILLAGASHIQCDIDDSLIPGAVNIARSSERYLFTWLKLSRYFAANPELAAVVLQCAPTDLWEHSDDKYFSPNEMSTYIPNFFTLFGPEEWCVYRHPEDARTAAGLILQHLPREWSPHINDGFRKALPPRVPPFDPAAVRPNIVQGTRGHAVNRRYLRKIIELCREHDVRLIPLYCPIYRSEYTYDEAYCNRVLETEFPDLKRWDFHDAPFDSSERSDAHHLNPEGARRFTREYIIPLLQEQGILPAP